MAGYFKIYMIGGSGGFLGSDGINPIKLQILVGTSDRQWLEPKYFDDELQSIFGITHMIPSSPVNDQNIIDGLIVFAPDLFIKSCPLIDDAYKYFDDLGKKRIDMGKDQPEFWGELVQQAQLTFDNIKLYKADIEDLRPQSILG